MIDDDAHAQLLTQLRFRIAALAAVHGAQLHEENNAQGWYWPGTTLVLQPGTPGATRVVVFPEDAYTTWVEFGRSVRVEIATLPEQLTQAVDEVLGAVGAVVAGRARQRLWYTRGGSEPVGWEAWIDLDGGATLHRSDGRVPGRLTRRRFEARDVSYAAFS